MKMLDDIKSSLFLTFILCCLFCLPYAIWFAEGSFPGYRILFSPGIFVLGFFSEEMPLLFKISVLILSQFLSLLSLILLTKKLVGIIQGKDVS